MENPEHGRPGLGGEGEGRVAGLWRDGAGLGGWGWVWAVLRRIFELID